MNTLIFMFVLALTLAICLLIVLLITYKVLKAKNEKGKNLDEDAFRSFLRYFTTNYSYVIKNYKTKEATGITDVYHAYRKRETT